MLSFFSLLLALANHVDTCVRVIRVTIASITFSPFVGYGFLRWELSQAFKGPVVSRVAFFRLATFKSNPWWLLEKKEELHQTEKAKYCELVLRV